jgi:prostatic aicd phosphatase
MVNSANAGLVGVVLLARHGDRSGTVFQNYTTYSSTQGYLSAYGSVGQRDIRFPRHADIPPESRI